MTDASLLAPEDVARNAERAGQVLAGLNRIILGQETLNRQVVVACLAQGHLLLEGLPGLGKTELVKGLASLLGLQFRRIQFTPDLLPGDITGGHILEHEGGGRRFVFHEGPIFSNVVLADEINRASPKTQSALLEAMQEHSVTTLGETRPLPRPFFVLATQNPIELEGTYPLPEAQVDRFMFKLEVQNLSATTLVQILEERRRGMPPSCEPVTNAVELEELFAAVGQVFLPRAVAEYIARLVHATQPQGEAASVQCRELVRYGASPRAAIAIAEAARAHALMAGKPNVGFDDVRAVARAAMAHRLVLQYQAKLDGLSAADIVDDLLNEVSELVTDTRGGIRDA